LTLTPSISFSTSSRCVSVVTVSWKIYEEQIRKLEARVGGDDKEVAEAKELKKTQVLDEAIEAIEDLEKFLRGLEGQERMGQASSAPSATSAPAPATAFDAGPRALRRTGAHSSSMVPSSRTHSKAISSILVRFDLSQSRSSSLTVTLRYRDPIRLEDVSRDDCKVTFKYPDDRLLPLRGIITSRMASLGRFDL
jgi:hypothetical protein